MGSEFSNGGRFRRTGEHCPCGVGGRYTGSLWRIRRIFDGRKGLLACSVRGELLYYMVTRVLRRLLAGSIVSTSLSPTSAASASAETGESAVPDETHTNTDSLDVCLLSYRSDIPTARRFTTPV
jgi:hypothetical protein